MKESAKNGYVAGGVLLVVGFIILYVWISNGRSENLTLLLGSVASLLGLGGILKPDFIGQLIHHWMEGKHISQSQYKPHKSPQNYTGRGNVYNIYNK